MKYNELIGKKIVAFRGYKEQKFGKNIVTLSFILFDDGRTYIQLDDQSKYNYHDCNSYARELTLCDDKKEWRKLFNQEGNYKETTDYDPF